MFATGATLSREVLPLRFEMLESPLRRLEIGNLPSQHILAPQRLRRGLLDLSLLQVRLIERGKVTQ